MVAVAPVLQRIHQAAGLHPSPAPSADGRTRADQRTVAAPSVSRLDRRGCAGAHSRAPGGPPQGEPGPGAGPPAPDVPREPEALAVIAGCTQIRARPQPAPRASGRGGGWRVRHQDWVGGQDSAHAGREAPGQARHPTRSPARPVHCGTQLAHRPVGRTVQGEHRCARNRSRSGCSLVSLSISATSSSCRPAHRRPLPSLTRQPAVDPTEGGYPSVTPRLPHSASLGASGSPYRRNGQHSRQRMSAHGESKEASLGPGRLGKHRHGNLGAWQTVPGSRFTPETATIPKKPEEPSEAASSQAHRTYRRRRHGNLNSPNVGGAGLNVACHSIGCRTKSPPIADPSAQHGSA